MPPNIHSVIDEMPILLRCRDDGVAHSWSRIEAKKPNALATASRYGSTESCVLPRMSL